MKRIINVLLAAVVAIVAAPSPGRGSQKLSSRPEDAVHLSKPFAREALQLLLVGQQSAVENGGPRAKLVGWIKGENRLANAEVANLVAFDAIRSIFIYLMLAFPATLITTQNESEPFWHRYLGLEHFGTTVLLSVRAVSLLMAEVCLFGTTQVGGEEEPSLLNVKHGRLAVRWRETQSLPLFDRSLGWGLALPGLLLVFPHETLHVALGLLPPSGRQFLNSHIFIYPLEFAGFWMLLHQRSFKVFVVAWGAMAALHGLLWIVDVFRGGGGPKSRRPGHAALLYLAA